jgi:hypothetical protein
VGQVILGIIAIAGLFLAGVHLIRSPEQFLAKMGRTVTVKHVRATRFLGLFSFLFIVIILVQWFKHP